MKRFRRHFMCTSSGYTLAFQLGKMHEVSAKSVLLRVGLRLGFFQPMGNA